MNTEEILRDETFLKELKTAIESGKETAYYFDGEDEQSYEVFDENIAYQEILAVLHKFLNQIK